MTQYAIMVVAVESDDADATMQCWEVSDEEALSCASELERVHGPGADAIISRDSKEALEAVPGIVITHPQDSQE